MTECEQVLRLLAAYCDGELPAEQSELVERHLAGCIRCLDRRDFRVRLQEIIRRKCGGVADLPPGLLERVQGILGQPPAR